MRIFYSFLIIICSTILILLPVSEGIYAYRTDQREDNIPLSTGVGVTSDNIQLLKPIYDNDTSTISLYSDEMDDAPYWTSYNATSRALLVAGLSENITRILTVDYDVAAFVEGGLTTFLNILPWIWIIIWVGFPIAGLAAIWMGKA